MPTYNNNTAWEVFDWIINLIKFQFFSKHWIIFYVLPSITAIIVLLLWGQYSLSSPSSLGTMITIVGIIWGLLLNFLILIITTNSSSLTEEKNNFSQDNLYGEVSVGCRIWSSPKKINNYLFVYYKIFFLIYLSLAFLIWYIFLIGIIDLLKLLSFCVKIPMYFVYMWALVFYMLNFLYLIYFLYYFLHELKG